MYQNIGGHCRTISLFLQGVLWIMLYQKSIYIVLLYKFNLLRISNRHGKIQIIGHSRQFVLIIRFPFSAQSKYAGGGDRLWQRRIASRLSALFRRVRASGLIRLTPSRLRYPLLRY